MTRENVMAALKAVVSPGRQVLTTKEVEALKVQTEALLQASGEAGAQEYDRWNLGLRRGLTIDRPSLLAKHVGKTVLVTGGTGCIGTTLLSELKWLLPERLISLSRGVSTPRSMIGGVEYLHADVRDRESLLKLFARVKPDIVYHLAAQHNPGLAEIEVARTLTTNITGTAHIIDACQAQGSLLIHASTGKALRPFSPDIYAASKKMSEWLLTEAVRAGRVVAAAGRFTHVGDNSIIAQRLADWTAAGEPVRLHGSDVWFYLQSAREAAHLLMCLSLDATSYQLKLGAIRDLDWPISLTDLALGFISAAKTHAPLYICGYEAGYEADPYPGLYDPELSGGISPLFNAMEAHEVAPSQYCAGVDLHHARPQYFPLVDKVIEELCRAAAADASHAELREMVQVAGWMALWGNVQAIPTHVLDRQMMLTGHLPATRFTYDDRAVVKIIDLELQERKTNL